MHEEDAEKDNDSVEVNPLELYLISETDTEQSFPVNLEMTPATAASKAAAEISFTEVGMVLLLIGLGL